MAAGMKHVRARSARGGGWLLLSAATSLLATACSNGSSRCSDAPPATYGLQVQSGFPASLDPDGGASVPLDIHGGGGGCGGSISTALTAEGGLFTSPSRGSSITILLTEGGDYNTEFLGTATLFVPDGAEVTVRAVAGDAGACTVFSIRPDAGPPPEVVDRPCL